MVLRRRKICSKSEGCAHSRHHLSGFLANPICEKSSTIGEPCYTETEIPREGDGLWAPECAKPPGNGLLVHFAGSASYRIEILGATLATLDVKAFEKASVRLRVRLLLGLLQPGVDRLLLSLSGCFTCPVSSRMAAGPCRSVFGA